MYLTACQVGPKKYLRDPMEDVKFRKKTNDVVFVMFQTQDKPKCLFNVWKQIWQPGSLSVPEFLLLQGSLAWHCQPLSLNSTVQGAGLLFPI